MPMFPNGLHRLRDFLRVRPAMTTAVGPITIDPIVQRSGNVLTFTARRTTNIANPENRSFSASGSTSYPPAANVNDFGGSFPSGSIAFAAGSATATFTITGSSAVQPE